MGGFTVLNFVDPLSVAVFDSLGIDRIARFRGFLNVILLSSMNLFFCGFGILATARIAVL